jgi:hypothetical protein
MRRKRRTKEEWKSTLEAQKDSGSTAPKYCAKHKIHLQTFYARKSHGQTQKRQNKLGD